MPHKECLYAAFFYCKNLFEDKFAILFLKGLTFFKKYVIILLEKVKIKAVKTK